MRTGGSPDARAAATTLLSQTAHDRRARTSTPPDTLQTGATMNGRALAQTQVALQQATITQPAQ
jgi:hypothetical protein